MAVFFLKHWKREFTPLPNALSPSKDYFRIVRNFHAIVPEAQQTEVLAALTGDGIDRSLFREGVLAASVYLGVSTAMGVSCRSVCSVGGTECRGNT